MAKWFVVVDMQNDFVSGALANPAAEAIVPAIKEAAEKALADGAKLIFTLDTHYDDYMKTGEGRKFSLFFSLDVLRLKIGVDFFPKI